MERKSLPYFLVGLAVIFAVLSFVFLPDVVIMRKALDQSASSTVAKPLAVWIPLIVALGGAVTMRFVKSISGKERALIVSLVGIMVSVFLIAVNI